jgi:tetratricopeptide (TPR) repeat protein
MSTGTVRLDGARDAASQYAWKEAFDLFAAADAVEPLRPEDLELMAECAWWIGKMRHCIALRERAYAAYLKEGEVRRAARVATDLCDHHADLLEGSAASAWIQKATRLLEDEPEGAEHGWLQLTYGLMARGEGDLEKMGSYAAKAAPIAARHGDKDLFALALACQGVARAYLGDPQSGLQMVEEATVGAVSGELGLRATGWIYCMMISVNAHLTDWQQAGQWTEAAVNWCNRQAINGFPGVCRVHRAEILRLRGALSDANTSLGPLDRAKLLPTQVDVALLLGDPEVARSAAAELEVIAARHPSPALRATAAAAAAAVELADGNLGLAATDAEEALRLYDAVDLAYEAARVSLLLGQIRRAQGDSESAHAEFSSALATFQSFGALPDAARARELLAAS